MAEFGRISIRKAPLAGGGLGTGLASRPPKQSGGGRRPAAKQGFAAKMPDRTPQKAAAAAAAGPVTKSSGDPVGRSPIQRAQAGSRRWNRRAGGGSKQPAKAATLKLEPAGLRWARTTTTTTAGAVVAGASQWAIEFGWAAEQVVAIWVLVELGDTKGRGAAEIISEWLVAGLEVGGGGGDPDRLVLSLQPLDGPPEGEDEDEDGTVRRSYRASNYAAGWCRAGVEELDDAALVPSQQSQREMLGRMLQGGDASGRTLADFLLASFPYGEAAALPASTPPAAYSWQQYAALADALALAASHEDPRGANNHEDPISVTSGTTPQASATSGGFGSFEHLDRLEEAQDLAASIAAAGGANGTVTASSRRWSLMLELPETSPTGAAGPVVNPLWFVVELKKASGKYDVTGRWPVGTGSNAVCATSLPGCITLDVLADDGSETIRRAFEVEKFAVKWFGRHSTEAVAAADEKAAVAAAEGLARHFEELLDPLPENPGSTNRDGVEQSLISPSGGAGAAGRVASLIGAAMAATAEELAHLGR